jgi:hypothetical protein
VSKGLQEFAGNAAERVVRDCEEDPADAIKVRWR